MSPIIVGSIQAGHGTPAVYVTVERDGVPALRIDIYENEPANYSFQDVLLWSTFVVIGFGNRLHLVSLESQSILTVRMSGYYGHVYPLDEVLLVADAEYLHAFARDGTKLWQSPRLGIDGVVVSAVSDGVVEGSGEWDPPGGWEPFKILLSSGSSVPERE